MAMSGTSNKPPAGISPPRAQSPFNKASTPLNTTGGALGTSLNGSFALQGEKVFLNIQTQNLVNSQCYFDRKELECSNIFSKENNKKRKTAVPILLYN